MGKLVFAFFGIILFAILLGFFVATVIVGQRKKVELPDVTGMGIVDALEGLNAKKLNLQISERAFDSVVPWDCIISQYPPPGEEVKEGRIVRVVVSRGMMQARVPDVASVSLREAQGVLKRGGWIVGRIAFVSSPYLEEGMVISQTPQADSEILPDSKVNLLISSGKNKHYFCMPDLIGKNVEEVKRLVGDLGMDVGEMQQETTSDWESGTILEQNPQAGYMISCEDTIGFKISVPDDEGGD